MYKIKSINNFTAILPNSKRIHVGRQRAGPSEAAVMRPVHKNKVKYLSGVSDWRARHNNSLLSAEKTNLVEKTADLTAPK